MSAIALVVITDGRYYCMAESVTSIDQQLPPFTFRCIVDDSGDRAYAAWLDRTFKDFAILHHPTRMGCAASVGHGWESAMLCGAEYVWHAEDDFTYNGPVDVGAMAAILDANPELAQLALKRGPHGPVEGAAGGLMEVSPDKWTDHDGWCTSSQIFTFNPSLIPRRAIEVVLADRRPKLESNVAYILTAQGYRFGYLGQTTDPQRITHIGANRMPAWLP